MAQSGFTPIQLYRSSTAAAAPTAGNLADGELAINTTDEKLYFKNAGGTVKLLASSASATGTVSSVDGSGGTTGLTLTGGPITTTGTLTLGGTLAVANGGTGGTTASAARTNLGATTIGANLFTLTNPSAVTFPRFNADNTVSALDAATFRTAIGAGTGGGSVTSVAFSGGTTGLTVTGSPITTSGTITLAGTLAVAIGGTGVPTSSGSGSVVRSTSPTLSTPVLGAASATSITNALGAVGTPSYTFTGDTNTGIYSPGADTIAFVEGGVEAMRIDSSGNVGIGVTPSAWWSGIKALQVGVRGAVLSSTTTATLSYNSFFDGTNFKYIATDFAVEYRQSNNNGSHAWFIAPSGTAGANITFTQAMTLDASGNLGIGGTPSTKLDVAATGGMMRIGGASGNNLIQTYTSSGTTGLGLWAGGQSRLYSTTDLYFSTGATLTTASPSGYSDNMILTSTGNLGVGTTSPAARLHAVNSGLAGQLRLQDVTTDATAKNGVMGGAHYTNAQAPVLGMWISSTSTSNVVYVGGGLGALNAATSIQFFTAGSNTTATGTLQAAITSAGYLEATYSDKVVALGNSGTATTINLAQGNVFTATLTGNCTFTLSGSNASSSRGSSFTLILTNDGTAGRTVAWAGGNFRFPGGAASLSRTTTANAVDIWVFFTPDNGTTWYGNISMKNMIA